MIAPIIADVKLLQIGALGSLRTSGNEKPRTAGLGLATPPVYIRQAISNAICSERF